jgi:hypothetical protein
MALMRHPVVAILAPMLLALAACSTPEEKLLDRRHELRALLGRIHDEFARASEGDGDGSPGEGGLLARLATGMERSHFEQYCLAVGRVERPFSLSAHLEAFMRDEDHVRDCRDAAELQARIEELERQVAERAAR